MRIALDAMGGDHAPGELVKGAVEAVNRLDTDIILVGDQETLEKELSSYAYPQEKIQIQHASQVVEMHEQATVALRKKKDSSIVVATLLVKEGKADAVVSCGNTGAQMAAALFILGRFEGIDRPPIPAVIPGFNSKTILLDIGANVDVKPEQLVQFAVLGQAYARNELGIESPSVGLLNNGEEESKGNQVAVLAHEKMKSLPNLNFIGNIEGRDLFTGRANVAVCDGFLGNIVLKTLEGVGMLVMERLRGRFGPEAEEMMYDFDYSKVGGAPLLGVEGISIVCHGSSKSEAVVNGIDQACRCVRGGLVESLRAAMGTVKI